MRYQDFTVQLSVGGEGECQAEVHTAVGARPKEKIELPIGARDAITHVRNLAKQDHQLRKEVRNGTRTRITPDEDPDRKLRRELGVPLYQALFGRDVGEAFRQMRDHVSGEDDDDEAQRIRLRLVFGAPSEEAPWCNDEIQAALAKYAAYPWEYLCDRQSGEFLAVDEYTPIVRSFDVGKPARRRRVPPPLRVLVVSANDPDNPLDLEREKQCLLAAIGDQSVMEVEFLDNVGFEKVERVLRQEGEKAFHVLHFMGHGNVDRQTGHGYLCFVNEKDEVETWTGEQIARKIFDCRSLLLVVLNACHGANLTKDPDVEPFHAVAPSLLLAGVPAVLAMQTSISDAAAIAFSSHFYRSLREHGYVEQAATVARKAVREQSLEFGYAALYLRPLVGRIVDVRKGDDPEREDDSSEPVSLGIRTLIQDREDPKQLSRDSEWLLDLRPYFDREQPRFLRDSASWNHDIFPAVRRFLRQHTREQRPLKLEISAHSSIAFAAGFVLEAKLGREITFVQNGPGGVSHWLATSGAVPSDSLWLDEPPIELGEDSGDAALVVSITRPVLPHFNLYRERSGLKLRRIFPMTIAPRPGAMQVMSGAHAMRLADQLAQRLATSGWADRSGTLHVFISAPNTFTFFLGRLSRPFGRIQLYEHDFQNQRHGTYEPSILLDGAVIRA